MLYITKRVNRSDKSSFESIPREICMNNKIYQSIRSARKLRYEIRGVSYAVHEWGSADDPLLLLLHGWGDTGATFQFLVDALQCDWRVVAPDWRGFGDSSMLAQSYWFPDYLADLDALLAILSANQPVRLLGHSMGGNIASLYAGIFPQRVSHLINVEGFGLQKSDPTNAPDNYRRWIESGRNKPKYASYESFVALANRIAKRSPNMSYDRALFVAGQWAYQDEDGRIKLKADGAHKLPNAVLYRRNEAEACWSRIVAPTLAVTGETSPFKSTAESWLLSDSRQSSSAAIILEDIPASGHMIHFEQPAALADLAERFLGS